MQTPVVRFVNGLMMPINREAWTIRAAGIDVATRRQFPLDLAWAVSIHKSQVRRCADTRARRTHNITLHTTIKSVRARTRTHTRTHTHSPTHARARQQGMSLDAVEMSLSRCFEYGQAYVALSRAKSLGSLRLMDEFVPSVVKAHPAVRVGRRSRVRIL